LLKVEALAQNFFQPSVKMSQIPMLLVDILIFIIRSV